MESNNIEFEYTGKDRFVVPKNVTSVRFHPSVIEVENEAFEKCNNLKGVILNEGLQKIGLWSFCYCTSLSSITIPSTVIEIGHHSFWSCNNLREVVLNNGLQKIGAVAFWYCTSLSSIKLPSTVTEVGSDAFYSCSSLREVVLYGVPREIGKNAFISCTSLERFTFPTISTRLDALIQIGHWEEIENEVNEVRGVVERSGGELFVSTQAMNRGNNWIRVRQVLTRLLD